MYLTFSAFLITGFSDPYCLLSILEDKDCHGSGSSNKPQKAVVRDSAKGQVLQTTIKKQTLNPIWDETFKLWVCKTFIESILPQLVGRSFGLTARSSFTESLKTCQMAISTLRCGTWRVFFFFFLRNKKYWLYCTVYFIILRTSEMFVLKGQRWGGVTSAKIWWVSHKHPWT